MGLGDMLDEVAKHFPEDADTEENDEIPRIAIVGKPNVGKVVTGKQTFWEKTV